jgi:uncharacterized protein YggE
MAAVASFTLLAPLHARAADAATGTITLMGVGESSAAPEYSSVTVTVTSICYDTSRAAKDANAALASKLVETLKRYAVGERDKVTASGGPNVLETETTFVGSEVKTICNQKWKATNTLTIEMAKITALPDLQDEALAAVDAVALNPTQTAQTYADLGAPSFHLYPETESRLRGESQLKAYQDARAQLDGLAATCTFADPQLILIAPPEYSIIGRAGGADLAPGVATPILPDELVVRANLKFQWSFQPTSTCAPAPTPSKP